jgi:hypothetical protein
MHNVVRPPWMINNRWRSNSILVSPRLWPGSFGWNWNRPWVAQPGFWGGGFWGPFSLFSMIAGAGIWGQTRYTMPAFGSPGSILFENYGLYAAACGPHNLVYVYGPNNSVMCAWPNQYVPPGAYFVDMETLQLVVM